MRPRKRVLLCCVDNDVLSEMRMVLAVWEFHVVSCATPEDALLLSGDGFDCALLIPAAGDYNDSLVVQLQRQSPGLPLVLLFRHRAQVQTLTSWVIYEGSGRAELREMLKTAVARRRGPKKVYGKEIDPCEPTPFAKPFGQPVVERVGVVA